MGWQISSCKVAQSTSFGQTETLERGNIGGHDDGHPRSIPPVAQLIQRSVCGFRSIDQLSWVSRILYF